MAPATDYSAPAPGPAPKTFEQGSEAEATRTLKPIPKTDTQLNSLPVPKLFDPNSRTTAKPIRQASNIRLISMPPQPAAVVDDGGWRASHD